LDVANANFAQRRFSSTFRGGSLAGRSISDVAGDLGWGALTPKDVPVGMIVQGRLIDRKQLLDLLGHRREHFLRRRPARHQRRDPPQRRLLVGNLPQPCLIGWITIHGPAPCRGTGAVLWLAHKRDGNPSAWWAATITPQPAAPANPGNAGSSWRGSPTREHAERPECEPSARPLSADAGRPAQVPLHY
jgi:hypothetical protein